MTIKKPVIILVKPQLAMNVGMVARAMLNFGFTSLRIVEPRDKDVLVNAVASSSGATEVLDTATIFSSLSDAVTDLNLVYATSARKRYMNKPVFNLTEAFETNILADENLVTTKVGILFGAEKSGLSNNDLNFANKLINIPTNENFSSLNLAAAVLLICYEWTRISSTTNNKNKIEYIPRSNKNKFQLAEFDKINHFFSYLEEALLSKNFFSDENRKDIMTRNLRNIFLRNNLTNAELKTLYGMVKILADKRD